jgi:hypothetical protein
MGTMSLIGRDGYCACAAVAASTRRKSVSVRKNFAFMLLPLRSGNGYPGSEARLGR